MGETQKKEIEKIIDDRFDNKIKLEIENQITSILNKKIWIIASVCIGIFMAVIGNIFYNNSKLVRTETILTEFIKNEKEIYLLLREEIKNMQEKHLEDIEKIGSLISDNDKSYADKFDEIGDNQTVIIYGLKNINPNFTLDNIVRGNLKNNKKR